MKSAATFSELLQGFFTDRLMGQCNASPLTIANYRDAFCLLIAYAVFTNARGQVLSRDGVQYILSQQVIKAREKCPSLKTKRVSPHVLRHSTAMDLLQNGVARSVIALWLGHESMDTTQIYLHASLELKEKAPAKTEPFRGRPRRYRPPDQLLAFLQAL